MASAVVHGDVGAAVAASRKPTAAGSRERHVFVVCTGEHCAEAGSQELLLELRHECRHTGTDLRVGASRCMGRCQLAPAVMENGRMLGWVSQRRLRSELCRLGIK